MIKKLTFKDITIYDNYISNTDEILNLLELKYNKFFLSRSIKESFTSKNDNPNGGDILDVTNIYQDLYNAIFKTISKELVPNFPDEIIIYRYKHGNFLKKHSDELLFDGMVSDLIFLKSSKNHLKVYTTPL